MPAENTTGCCPTCGRPYAKARRSTAATKPTQWELYEREFLDAAQRRALTSAQLYAYCKRVAPVEDLLFIQATASQELSDRIDELLNLTRKISRDEVNRIFDARRHELSPELPEPNEAEFWRYHHRRVVRERGQKFRQARASLIQSLRAPEIPYPSYSYEGAARSLEQRVIAFAYEHASMARELASQAFTLCPWLKPPAPIKLAIEEERCA